MKKIIAHVLMLTAIFSLLSVGWQSGAVSEDVLNYTPVIDGVIDDAYLWSYHIEHEWVSCWGLGRYNADNGKDSYGWDVKATSYFLWSDSSIYLAIKVIDDDIGVIDDYHFQRAIKDRTQWGPYYQDGVMAYLEFDGMLFEIQADADGKMATVYAEPNFGQTVWANWHSFPEFEKNAEDGLWAFRRTDDGYVFEFEIPVKESVRDKVFARGFHYGLAVGDATSDSGYANDYALSLEGIIQEGNCLKDVIFVYDIIPPYNDFSKYSLYFSDTESYDRGDVNGDGKVDTRDLIRLMKYIAAGGDDACGVTAYNPDITCDGTVNTVDLVRLMKLLARYS